MKRIYLLLIVLVLSGCGAAQEGGKVAVGLGYNNDVQFAPLYVALEKGFYKDAGLEVDLQPGFASTQLPQLGKGQLQFALADGQEVLTRRTQEQPIKMVWLLYQQFPVAVFSKASANITKPQDLKGKTIGIPERSGATYTGLLGLLRANGLAETDVNLREISFTQYQAVRAGTVQAAVGYANNEPVKLTADGEQINVLPVAQSIPLVSNGIVVSEEFAQKHPAMITSFLKATARGLQFTLVNPDEAFQIALKYLPEVKSNQQQTQLQRKVLDATLPYWHSAATDQNGLGYQDPQAWQATYTFLRDSGLLVKDTDLAAAYTNQFAPGKDISSAAPVSK